MFKQSFDSSNTKVERDWMRMVHGILVHMILRDTHDLLFTWMIPMV